MNNPSIYTASLVKLLFQFGTFNLHNKTYLVQPPDAEHKTHAVTQVLTLEPSPDDAVHLPTKGIVVFLSCFVLCVVLIMPLSN